MCAFLTHLVTPIITIQQLHSSIFSRQVTICWLSLWSRSLVDLPSKCKQVFCIVNASVPVCNFPFERMGHSKAWTQLLLKVKIWIFNVCHCLIGSRTGYDLRFGTVCLLLNGWTLKELRVDPPPASLEETYSGKLLRIRAPTAFAFNTHTFRGSWENTLYTHVRQTVEYIHVSSLYLPVWFTVPGLWILRVLIQILHCCYVVMPIQCGLGLWTTWHCIALKKESFEWRFQFLSAAIKDLLLLQPCIYFEEENTKSGVV